MGKIIQRQEGPTAGAEYSVRKTRKEKNEQGGKMNKRKKDRKEKEPRSLYRTKTAMPRRRSCRRSGWMPTGQPRKNGDGIKRKKKKKRSWVGEGAGKGGLCGVKPLSKLVILKKSGLSAERLAKQIERQSGKKGTKDGKR